MMLAPFCASLHPKGHSGSSFELGANSHCMSCVDTLAQNESCLQLAWL